MTRIVIVGPSETSRAQLSRILALSGYPVYRACATNGELRRTLSQCDDGLIVIAGGVPDGRPDDIAADYGDIFQILMIARPESLLSCESREVFKLSYPCPIHAVTGAVEMLAQLHEMRLPRRAGGEKDLVERAKRRLMRDLGIDEAEAHRRMQRYAMRHNMKMTDYAAMLLHDSEGTEA